MVKASKALSIRQYVETHPNAKAPEVAKATNTHVAYAYSILQKMRGTAKKKAAAASSPSKGQEILREVISEEEKIIANLNFKLKGLLDVNEAQQNEIQRLCTIVQYLEHFVARVGKL